MKPVVKPAFILAAILVSLYAPAQQKEKVKEEKSKLKTDSKNLNTVTIQPISPLDTLAIDRTMGMKGKWSNGEYEITVPQNDLDIEADGFKIIPAMGLGTWIDFSPASIEAMIMGDMVLTENDLKPIQQEVIKQGLTITAIHNHFVRNHPNIMYMHIGGAGNTEATASKAKAVLDKVKEVRANDPSKGNTSSGTVNNSLDLVKLDMILQYKGEMVKGDEQIHHWPSRCSIAGTWNCGYYLHGFQYLGGLPGPSRPCGSSRRLHHDGR